MIKFIFRPSFLLTFALLGFVLLNLGNRPLANPDEGRYVEIPREMVESGDFVTPRLNGLKYFEKPPLFYWMQASAIKTFGINPFSMRLWVAALAIATIIAVYRFMIHVDSRESAFFSGSILISTALFYALSRLIILDMPLTFFITTALLLFFVAFHHDGMKRRWGFYGFSLLLGLGILTKGVVTLAIVGPIIVLWLSVTKQWGNLRPFYPLSCALMLLIVAAPWHILASFENTDFIHKYFVVEHLERYTTKIHMRYQPAWFFIPVFLIGLLPWTLNLFHHHNIKADRYDPLHLKSFLWIWCGWVLFFFSLSHSKLIPYILPAFPPVAILLGRFFTNVYNEFVDIKILRLANGLLYLCMGAGAASLHWTSPQLFDGYESLVMYTQILGAVFVVCGLAMLILRQNRSFMAIQYLLAIFIVILLNEAAPHGQKPSTQSLATFITHSGESRKIVSYKSYFQDLPVYTKQRIIVCDATGELEFGALAEPEKAHSWIITEADLLKRLKLEKFWIIGKRAEINALIKNNKSIKFSEIMVEKNIVLIKNK